MEKFSKFLWKIFSATMVFLLNIDFDTLRADEEQEIPTCTDAIFPKHDKFTTVSANGSTPIKSQRICPSGKYLYSCNSTIVGINWLKGMESETCKTPDYLSYNIDSDDITNMSNLRSFFNGTETFAYYAKAGNTLTVTPSNYKTYRNMILSVFCTDQSGKFSTQNVECRSCPNGGYVSESTVQKQDNDSYVSGKILWDTWDVRTIADCYMNEFSDNTGNYIYKSSNIQSTGNKGNNCYYSEDVDGSYLYYYE